MAGIYLAEYGRKSWLAEVIRFINDILLSAPSIVVGLFVYTIVVAQMEHFSGWAGVIALALLQVPIVIRTTENMLKLVPDNTVLLLQLLPLNSVWNAKSTWAH